LLATTKPSPGGNAGGFLPWGNYEHDECEVVSYLQLMMRQGSCHSDGYECDGCEEVSDFMAAADEE
jgi:hypothetical protein